MNEEQKIVESTESPKKSLDWVKLSGFIATGVILLSMMFLNWIGVVKIDNVDSISKYTKESTKLVTMNYFTLSKDKVTSENANVIVAAVTESIASTTQKLKDGKVDLTNIKTYVIDEVNKVIDQKAKDPIMIKQLANIAITAAFSSLDTYASKLSMTSADYIKILDSISEGIKEGYKAAYPPPAPVKETTAVIIAFDYALIV